MGLKNINFSLPALVLSPDQIAKLIFRWKGVVLDSLLEDATSVDKSYNGEKVSITLDKIRKLKDQLAELETTSDPNTEANEDNLRIQVDNLESQVGKRFKEMVRSSEWSTYDELKSSLPDDNALLEIIRYNDISNNPCYGIALTSRKNDAQWISVENAKSIDIAVASYRKAIANGDEVSLKTQIQILSEKLWKPVAATLPSDIKKLYIGADGPLNFLSFATLQDDEKKFITEKYQIAYVGSGRDLLRPAKPVDKQCMVIYANPDFAFHDISKSVSVDSNLPAASAIRSAELAEFAKVQLPQLPGTQTEATIVSGIAKDCQWSEETHLGADASKKGLMAMKAPAVLHLATHGFFLGVRREAEMGHEE